MKKYFFQSILTLLLFNLNCKNIESKQATFFHNVFGSNKSILRILKNITEKNAQRIQEYKLIIISIANPTTEKGNFLSIIEELEEKNSQLQNAIENLENHLNSNTSKECYQDLEETLPHQNEFEIIPPLDVFYQRNDSKYIPSIDIVDSTIEEGLKLKEIISQLKTATQILEEKLQELQDEQKGIPTKKQLEKKAKEEEEKQKLLEAQRQEEEEEKRKLLEAQRQEEEEEKRKLLEAQRQEAAANKIKELEKQLQNIKLDHSIFWIRKILSITNSNISILEKLKQNSRAQEISECIKSIQEIGLSIKKILETEADDLDKKNKVIIAIEKSIKDSKVTDPFKFKTYTEALSIINSEMEEDSLSDHSIKHHLIKGYLENISKEL